jgi:site-specific recombinase XerD
MSEHLTFNDLTIEFCEDRVSSGKSWRTVEWYYFHFRKFEVWLNENNLGEIGIEEITTDLLKLFFSNYSLTHNKGGCHSAYRALKAILNYFKDIYEPVNWKNPIDKVKIAKNNIAPLSEIPMVDVRKLIDQTNYTQNPERDKALLFTLVDTGVRMSELLDLNVGDIDLTTGTVRVCHGKGNKFRNTFLGESGKKAIKEYLKTRNNLNKTEPLFLNDDFLRLKSSGLRQIIKRISKKAKIGYQGIHCFRRLFCLTLYRSTGDIYLVCNLAGHSSPDVTRRYLNLTSEDLREAHHANSPADRLN